MNVVGKGLCDSCGEGAVPQVKGLCPRCYARSRIREAVCVDCGLLRRQHRGGRCARCYRLAHLVVRTCETCGKDRPTWGPICRACRLAASSVPGACEACHRVVARLWGRRCSRCAKSHWRTASCTSCLSWSASIEDTRCRACREFDRHNTTVGACRSCRRRLSLNCYRRCRLCTVARRNAHSGLDPKWSDEPGLRGGIQLFFGDLQVAAGLRDSDTRRLARRHLPAGPAPVTGASTTAVTERLFPVPIDLSRVESLSAVTRRLAPALAALVAGFGEARGWTVPTTAAVSTALALLVEVGPGDPSPESFAELRRLRPPVSRVCEFLAAQGAPPATLSRLPGWIDVQTARLPAAMRAEVACWVEVLEGRAGRGPVRCPGTVRHYLSAARPVLEHWSATSTTLREVTTEQVEAELALLKGSRRTMTAVALRSLFCALKSKRQVFLDPARAVSPGRFPQRPVLGLDDRSRSRLLTSVTRADHRLVVLLAGVHAMSRADITGLVLDDVDLDAGSLLVRGRRRPLDRVVSDHVVSWLDVRRERWPNSANPYLLVTYKSAYGIGPVSTGYFKGVFDGLSTTAAGLRADRLLAEAGHGGGDPLRLVRLFGLSPATALRYATSSEPDGLVKPS